MPLPLLIKAERLSKSYKMAAETVAALKSIDLEVSRGESMAIMGPSGSGKSTLLHLLGCLDSPSSGRYLLDDKDVSALPDHQLSLIRSRHIGFVFQSFNLIPQLTVYENVALPFLYQPAPLSENEKKHRILSALHHVKLSHRLSHRPSQLSGGEMQRVAIARAIAIEPLLILADEPTGNLDRETGQAILEIFQCLHTQGTTLILVTHDPQVASYCQRIVRMNDGEIAHAPLA